MAAPSQNISDRDFDQIAFANYLKGLAKAFYDPDTNQPYPHITKGLKYKKVEKGLPHTEKADSTRIIDWLLGKNIVEVALYKSNSTTDVFAVRTAQGKNAILRKPIRQLVAKDDKPRIKHPAMLQPLPDASLSTKNGAMDILPFGFFMKTEDVFESPIKYAGLNILRDMHFAAGLWAPEGYKNDLCLLPDGTPLGGDPDLLRFTRQPVPPQENVHRMASIIQDFPYMAPVAWIKDGKPAQDKFFGADYLTGAAPIVAASKLDGHPRGSAGPAFETPTV